MKLDYQHIIESNFLIRNPGGSTVPFRLNDVQRKYLAQLYDDYEGDDGWRENILKARREGFSSLIEAILTADFIHRKGSGNQVVSHKDQETKPHIERINLFLDSYLDKNKLTRAQFLDEDTGRYLKTKLGAEFLIGTAGAKTLGRGGTLQNIHWTEVGFYPNTEILNAETIVPPAEEQVDLGVGKIFRESTGNMIGDFWHGEIERSVRGETAFKFRFYAWFEDPTNRLDIKTSEITPTKEERDMMDKYGLDVQQIAWYRAKATAYKSRAKFMREYPTTWQEAFLATGSGFFDPDILKFYNDRVKDPIQQGQLAQDGGWI